MRTVEQLAQSTNPALVRAFGAIRRFVITLTDSAIWQIAGALMPDGQETLRAEVFGVVGLHSRPPADVQADAIVVMGGDANNPAIVGMRDEKTRAAVAGGVQPDETALYNSKAIVYIKDDGTIEARSASGVAVPLATLADAQAIRNALDGHHHTYLPGTGAATTTTLNPAVPAPSGTTKLRGE